MIEHLQILTGAGAASNDGIFIPVTDIAGMTGAEISETGITLECKLAYGFLNAIYAATALITPVGLPEPEKSDPSGAGANLFTESITIKTQRLQDLRDNSISLPTLPSTGSYMGQGGLTLEDIWPNAEKIAATASTGGSGVVIPDAWITGYGGAIPVTTDSDGRLWVAAFITAINHTIAVRNATVASAITRKTDPNTIRLTGATIPAEFYDAANPTTGLSAADLPYVRLTQEAITIEYEVLVDPILQTLEIRVATT